MAVFLSIIANSFASNKLDISRFDELTSFMYFRLKLENEELQKKEISKEKDTNPDIWVPPSDLIESDDEDVPVEGKEGKKEKKESNKQPKEIEEDTYSDLLGSDHEDDELDNDDDNEDDFDELDEDDNDKMDVAEKKKSSKPVKIDQKNKIVKNKSEKDRKLAKVVATESKNKLLKAPNTAKLTVDKSQKRKEAPTKSTNKLTERKKSKKV